MPEFIDNTPQDGNTYVYQVRAVRSSDNVRSNLTSGVSVVMPSVAQGTPSVPTGLTGVLSGGQITLSWTPNPTAENSILAGYEIVRDTNVVLGTWTPGATGTLLDIDDDTVGSGSNQWTYVDSWSTSTGPDKFGGGDHYSSTTGADAILSFTGTKVIWYGAKASHHGQATVQIDSGTPVTVDCYSATRVEEAALWTSPTLSNAAHTLTISVAGTKNAASTGFVVPIDHVAVTTGSSSAPSFVVTNPPIGNHTYNVRSIGTDSTRSGFSNAYSSQVAPPAPTGWTATLGGSPFTTITIAWPTPPAGVDSVDINRNGTVVQNVTGSNSFADTGRTLNTAYTYQIRYIADGIAGPYSTTQTVTPAAPSAAVTLLTAGDIEGDGTGTSNVILTYPNTTPVLNLGDAEYQGSPSFPGSYHNKWGRFFSRTWATPGNHDAWADKYEQTNGFFHYFGARAWANGLDAGTSGGGTFDIGTKWRCVVYNGCAGNTGGSGGYYGTGTTSADKTFQLNQFQANLDAANAAGKFIIVAQHFPVFSVGSHSIVLDAAHLTYWQKAVDAGARISLCGHSHAYERWVEMDRAGNTSAGKCRHFVVGTGGISNDGFNSTNTKVELRSNTYGVLELSLTQTGYTATFYSCSRTSSGTKTQTDRVVRDPM